MVSITVTVMLRTCYNTSSLLTFLFYLNKLISSQSLNCGMVLLWDEVDFTIIHIHFSTVFYSVHFIYFTSAPVEIQTKNLPAVRRQYQPQCFVFPYLHQLITSSSIWTSCFSYHRHVPVSAHWPPKLRWLASTF